ncbi:P1 family peptidase [Sorangium sp. So ce1504]|uniref:DmpA family aminopeptidase n=1 Tax=Sorangium sp. So ce1504 TaxID=3133337 RepID=UPI003F5D87F2
MRRPPLVSSAALAAALLFFLFLPSLLACAGPRARPSPPAASAGALPAPPVGATRRRARDLGIVIGRLPTGKLNAITDVPGVRVGHVTHHRGAGRLDPGKGPVRTGVTVILPTSDDFWHNKVPAASFVLNGNGEMTGLHYVREFGVLETPIVFTNTLAVGRALDGAIQYMLRRYPAIGVDEPTVTPIVGECDDSALNDIRGLHVSAEDVIEAAERAADGPVEEGAVGGGTGMICYDFKCGIGTASRVLPEAAGGFTVGAIVQANFGARGELRVDGVPVGQEIRDLLPVPDVHGEGSLLAVVAIDAPLSARQLERVARRIALAVGRTGTISRDGSGDLFLAFATGNRVPSKPEGLTRSLREVDDARLNPMFQGAEEAVEEAILNAMTMATTTFGQDDHVAHAIPLDRLREAMERYGRLDPTGITKRRMLHGTPPQSE